VAVGVNVFITDTLRRDPMVGALAELFEDLPARARNRDVPHSEPFQFEAKRDANGLRQLGYRSIVLHLDALSEKEAARTIRVLEATLGPAGHEQHPDMAWEL
jgi:hypothetical protein